MKTKSKDKNYSIIIVTGATSTNKEFVISSKLIKNSIAAFVVLLLIFGFIIFDYLTISYDKEKARHLERDNVKKEEMIANLSASISDFESQLQKIAIFKKRISVAMGLTSPDALMEVGEGGGPETNLGNAPITNLGNKVEVPNIPESQDSILERAEKIRQEARNIKDTLKFVEGVMDKQKVRLASTPAIWPTKGYLTSPLGNRIHPFTGKVSYHSGQDIATQYGNKVIAPANGVVLVADNRDYYGNLIVIDHGFGYTTRYGHLSSFNVKEGQHVKREQIIGYVGNSGRSSAAHLHYEVRYFGKAQNPMDFIID